MVLALLGASSALAPATTAPSLPRPVPNAAVEAQARRYFSLGNKVKQQLGPTNAEDLHPQVQGPKCRIAPGASVGGVDARIQG